MLFLKPRRLWAAPVFFLSFSVFALSSIDARFKMSRSGATTLNSNELTGLYRGVIARSLYSRCQWFPSDSEFMAWKSRECGPLKGTLFAFGRFMMESDASRLGSDTILESGRLRFVDFGGSCEIF